MNYILSVRHRRPSVVIFFFCLPGTPHNNTRTNARKATRPLNQTSGNALGLQMVDGLFSKFISLPHRVPLQRNPRREALRPVFAPFLQPFLNNLLSCSLEASNIPVALDCRRQQIVHCHQSKGRSLNKTSLDVLPRVLDVTICVQLEVFLELRRPLA